MTAYEIAKNKYSEYNSHIPFSTILHAHYLYGYVFCTPEVFICGRPILKGAYRENIVEPWIVFDTVDTWFIYLVAICKKNEKGTEAIRYFYEHEPYPLKWVAWCRNNSEVRYFDYNTVKKRVLGE